MTVSLSFRLGEEFVDATEPSYERVDVVLIVIEVKRGARGRSHAEGAHQGLRAVMAGADTDALLVEDLRDVMGVHVTECERDHARAIRSSRRWSKDRELFEGVGQGCDGVRGERALVLGDRFEANRFQVVHRRTEPYRFGDRGGACLELPGDLVGGEAVEPDVRDHLAAAEERWHRLEQRSSCVEHADAGWSEHLVAR